MGVFIVRRIIISFFTLLAATFLVYIARGQRGQPAGRPAGDPGPGAEQAAASRRASRCSTSTSPSSALPRLAHRRGRLPRRRLRPRRNIQQQEVTTLTVQAMGSTLRLVTAATVLAIVFGVTIGIVSALRQYTGFDYVVTFLAFLFFSLPIFWVAVLLKEFGAIRVNDWLRDPTIPLAVIVGLTLLAALVWQAVLGGSRRRRLVVALRRRGRHRGRRSSTCRSRVVLAAPPWARSSSSSSASRGPSASRSCCPGLRNRGVLYASVAAAAVGLFGSIAPGAGPARPLVDDHRPVRPRPRRRRLLAGYLLGGLDRPQAMRAAVLSALLTGVTVFTDYVLVAFAGYSERVRGVVVKTIGVGHPQLRGHVLGGLPRPRPVARAAHHGAHPHQLRHLRPLHPGVDARGPQHGLRAHGAGQGPHRAHGHGAARVPQRPDPRDDARGVRLRRGHRRGGHHRDRVRLVRHGGPVPRRACSCPTPTRSWASSSSPACSSSCSTSSPTSPTPTSTRGSGSREPRRRADTATRATTAEETR